jgi:ethanolamine utilization protein EutS
MNEIRLIKLSNIIRSRIIQNFESEESSMADEHRDQIRIVQETVAGKEITFAHIMGGPAPIIYQKLGLNPQVDYGSSAIGIMNMTPSESAVIASDIAVKSGNVYLGFADRFTGTLIITGEISDVQTAMEEIVDYFRDTLGYVVCNITKR